MFSSIAIVASVALGVSTSRAGNVLQCVARSGSAANESWVAYLRTDGRIIEEPVSEECCAGLGRSREYRRPAWSLRVQCGEPIMSRAGLYPALGFTGLGLLQIVVATALRGRDVASGVAPLRS